MLRPLITHAVLASLAVSALGCGDDAQNESPKVVVISENQDDDTVGDIPDSIPALGNGEDDLSAVTITTIANENDGLAGPRDLEINPNKPEELWVVNRDDHSATIVTNWDSGLPSSTKHSGLGNTHFAAKVSALAFGEPGYMATAQQEDEITQSTTPHDFMGPTLWPSDSAEFDAGHASHLDMLHNSPLSSGIAWDTGNAYWIFDGYHESITHYDFQSDHGPGGSDHRDGIVRRYAEGEVSVVNGIVAHLAFDRENQLLYIADTGNNRIAVLETDTGSVGASITPNYDGTNQRQVDGATLRTLIDGAEVGLSQPAGLELVDGILYVGDNGTSKIYAFSTEGEVIDSLDLSSEIPPGAMMGLEVDAQGRILVANSEDNTVIMLAGSE